MNEAEFKREVMMKALEVIDCHISCIVNIQKPGEMSKQYGTIEETRLCHSQILIVSEEPRTSELFNEIMFVPRSKDPNVARNLFKNYDDFRVQVKKELGYPGKMHEDGMKNYFVRIGFSYPESRKPIPFTKL